MPPRDDLPLGWTNKWPACDIEVLQAVSDVYENMTPSHSWSSKIKSFTSLVRNHLDQPVIRFFERYEVFAGKDSFSEYFKHGEYRVFEWLDRISTFLPLGRDFDDSEDKLRFIHTMETLRDLVVVCAMFKGKDTKIWSPIDTGEGSGVRRKRASRRLGGTRRDGLPWYFRRFLELEPGVYCELCNSYSSHHTAEMNYLDSIRGTEVERNRSLEQNPPIRIKGASLRYCIHHDPDLSHALYKKASARRKAFYSLMCIIQEGEKFFFGRVRSHHEEIRKTAFSVVQLSKPKDLKVAEEVVERFYSSLDESAAEGFVRKSDMLKAYSHYFGRA